MTLMRSHQRTHPAGLTTAFAHRGLQLKNPHAPAEQRVRRAADRSRRVRQFFQVPMAWPQSPFAADTFGHDNRRGLGRAAKAQP